MPFPVPWGVLFGNMYDKNPSNILQTLFCTKDHCIKLKKKIIHSEQNVFNWAQTIELLHSKRSEHANYIVLHHRCSLYRHNHDKMSAKFMPL